MSLNFNRNRKTIKDHVSDDILKEFLNQLPWMKDHLIQDEYKDVVKIKDIEDATIKIKKGNMSGKFFVEILKELPRFDFENKHYQLWMSTFTRASIPPKKHINKWSGFHIRKLLRSTA